MFLQGNGLDIIMSLMFIFLLKLASKMPFHKGGFTCKGGK
jgi:hypothetical protein